MKTHVRPSYYVCQAGPSNGFPRPNSASFFEVRDGENHFLFTLSKRTTLDQILKRGIPFEDAKALFYQLPNL